MSTKVILDEKLIECVRRHEVLFNTDLKDYSDNCFKLKIWCEVARSCGISSGDEAKKQWKNLRDGYRSALKMYKSGKIDPNKKVKTWKYFKQMHFLRPYMRDRQRHSNLSAQYSEDTNTYGENSQEYKQSSTVKEEITELFETPGLIEEEIEVCSHDDSPVPSKKSCSIRSSIEQLDDRPREIQWTQSEICHDPEDSLKLFFDSMYVSTKKLSPALQRVVKNKLFQAVNEAEIEMEQAFKTD